MLNMLLGSWDWYKFIESKQKNYEAPLLKDLILKVEIEKQKAKSMRSIYKLIKKIKKNKKHNY